MYLKFYKKLWQKKPMRAADGCSLKVSFCSSLWWETEGGREELIKYYQHRDQSSRSL